MEMAELKKLTEDKRQAVHQHPPLSQCQLGRDSECVRKTPHGVETRSHSTRDVLEPLPLAGFLFASRYPQTKWRKDDYSFEPQNASKALLLVLQAIKKPAVTRTSGQVMGELTIWPSS